MQSWPRGEREDCARNNGTTFRCGLTRCGDGVAGRHYVDAGKSRCAVVSN